MKLGEFIEGKKRWIFLNGNINYNVQGEIEDFPVDLILKQNIIGLIAPKLNVNIREIKKLIWI